MLIHQIWIGNKAPPEKWMKGIRDFSNNYGHTYMFWGNKEVRSLDLKRYNLHRIFNEFSKSKNKNKWAGMADLLRMIILFEKGGVYIDSDSMMVNPSKLDQFIRKNNQGIWYAESSKEKPTLIANGTIGCEKGDPHMFKMLSIIQDYADSNKEKEVWERTGPGFVTYYVKNFYPDPKAFQIFPSDYFYPYGWHGLRETPTEFPKVSMLYQIGYTTNSLGDKDSNKSLTSIALFSAIFISIWYFTRSKRKGF